MKRCPKCKVKYPDSDKYCKSDGSELMPIPESSPSSTGTFCKKIVIVLIASAFLILLLINAFPYLLKFAASNCKVSLKGLAIKDQASVGGIAEQAKDILGSILGTPDASSSDKKPEGIALILGIDNRNPFPFTVSAIDIRLYINSRRFASGILTEDKKVRLGAWDATELRLPLDISYTGAAATLLSLITASEVRYLGEGEIGLDTFLGRMNYPIKVEGINVPVM